VGQVNVDNMLSDDQKKALELILEFLESKTKIAFTISGFAGTGKSFLTTELIDILYKIRKNYVLCAPTHKAKNVLQNFTQSTALTIHKLLSLAPNIELIDLDFNDLKFLIHKTSEEFPSNSLVIVDEASMVNDYLYDLLIDRCVKHNSKILFIGDIAQLRPVNSDYFSKVFDTEDIFYLTHIFRQKEDSALSEILLLSRENYINNFETRESEFGSIYVTNNPIEFLREGIKYIDEATKNTDIMETKILSYTNDRVELFNKKLHNYYFNNEEYGKNEILTCYDNFEFGYGNFWNGMDYIIIEEPKKININIPNVGIFPGFNLTVFDSTDNVNLDFNILSNELSYNDTKRLGLTIEAFRLEAINYKMRGSRKSSMLWKEYYRILSSFTTPNNLYYENRLIRKKSIDYGYAVTIHKS